MKRAVIERLFKRFDGGAIEREVEEELRFHLDLLAREEHLQGDASFEEAEHAARKRFGDVERIKGQCVEISRRSHPLVRALKIALAGLFLAGVVLRAGGPNYWIDQAGNMMILIAVLGRLLLYVRALTPSRFLEKQETASPLMLRDAAQTSFAVYEEDGLTPVERLISGK